MSRATRDHVISEGRFQELSSWLSDAMGLHLVQRNRGELLRKLAAAMGDFGFDDLNAFLAWLVRLSPTRQQIEILAGYLTVGETYFFRERTALEVLERDLLPALMSARQKTERRLRFWSAGCSTGEEPYSLAILLDRMVPDLAAWNVTILATDINPAALRKAEEGVYSAWSFRDSPPWLKERYFERIDRRHHVLRRDIRERVTFAYLNLSEDRYPALQNSTNAMDFIFCRNVLMYLAPQQITAVTERFRRALLEGGFLIVSPVETALLAEAPFTAVRYRGWTFHTRGPRALAPAEAPAADAVRAAGRPPAPSPSAAPRNRASAKRPRPAPAEARPAEVPKRALAEEAAELYRSGAYREAEERLRRAVAAEGKTHETVVLLARVLANRGKLEEALRWCEEAVAADKLDPGLHYLHATILEEEQRVDEAKASLVKALYLDGDFVLAHFALAALSLRAGKKAEARKHLKNVGEALSGHSPDDVLAESEGITAARMTEIVTAIRTQEGL